MDKLNAILNKRSVKYGLPFLLLMLGGSFALKQFTSLRYNYGRKNEIYDKCKELGIPMKKPGEVTLEGEYEKLKQVDIENWTQKRGPRPWEENISS